jgi:hypothetical protein
VITREIAEGPAEVPKEFGWSAPGIRVARFLRLTQSGGRVSISYVRVRWLQLGLLLAAYPTLYAVYVMGQRLVVRHRRRAGFCVVCGYDLRGTPERCPECGTDAIDDNADATHKKAERGRGSSQF